MGGAHQIPLQLPWFASATCSQFVLGGWHWATPAESLSDLPAAIAPAQALCCLQGAGRHASESLAASTSTWACITR